MKVKLHKGPSHGKTVVVQEGQKSIIVNTAKAKPIFDRFSDYMVGPLAEVNMDITTSEYRMKIFSHPDFGTFPCVDPQGRVYFEYVG